VILTDELGWYFMAFSKQTVEKVQKTGMSYKQTGISVLLISFNNLNKKPFSMPNSKSCSL